MKPNNYTSSKRKNKNFNHYESEEFSFNHKLNKIKSKKQSRKGKKIKLYNINY